MIGPRAEVEATLASYFDALYDSDAAALADVMHPRAIYATADEPELLIRSMDEYLPIVAARQAPRARGETRKDRIESIQLAGDNTAFAQVRCSIGPRDFVDFLSLIRTRQGWRIIAKVFHFKEQEH